MEKRHYFDGNITAVTTLTRTMTGNEVTKFEINGTTYDIAEMDQYELLVSLPADQPFRNIIADSENGETWTKDGLYLHASDDSFYVKDFLEDVPPSYQNKMLNNLSEESIKKRAEYLIDNTISPKEFAIVNNGSKQGIQDQIVAYIRNEYYINSVNNYSPNINDECSCSAMWKIPKNSYDTEGESGISDGIRSDMVLSSNKLIYLLSFEGLTEGLTEGTEGNENKYLEGSELFYLCDTVINDVVYQIYYNINFLYNENGEIETSLSSSDDIHTITIKDVFKKENLAGKVLKV